VTCKKDYKYTWTEPPLGLCWTYSKLKYSVVGSNDPFNIKSWDPRGLGLLGLAKTAPIN
jgi:hypothetical protein